MKEDDDWPENLAGLRVPPPSVQFRARIVQATAEMPQVGYFSDLGDLWRWLFHPKPALGFALTLAVGVFLGWQVSSVPLTSSANTVDTTTNSAVETFYFSEGNLL